MIFYTFIIAFIFVFLAELGDKTQILILSFASKVKIYNILLGIAIGSFLSHGIAILFGSKIASLENNSILYILKNLTYITFIVLGIISLISKDTPKTNNKIFKKIGNTSGNYILIIAICIMIGEIGDKTFLTSIGLGIEYSSYKIPLVIGAILGMVASNSIAIFFGKFLEKSISDKHIKIISSLIFIVFGILSILIQKNNHQ